MGFKGSLLIIGTFMGLLWDYTPDIYNMDTPKWRHIWKEILFEKSIIFGINSLNFGGGYTVVKVDGVQRNFTSERWLLGKGPLINPSDMGVAIAMKSFPGGKRCIKARAMKWGNQMIKWPKWLLVILRDFHFDAWSFGLVTYYFMTLQEWLGGDFPYSNFGGFSSVMLGKWVGIWKEHLMKLETAVLVVSWKKNKVGVVSFREGRSAFSGWAKPFVMLILHPWSLVS